MMASRAGKPHVGEGRVCDHRWGACVGCLQQMPSEGGAQQCLPPPAIPLSSTPRPIGNSSKESLGTLTLESAAGSLRHLFCLLFVFETESSCNPGLPQT